MTNVLLLSIPLTLTHKKFSSYFLFSSLFLSCDFVLQLPTQVQLYFFFLVFFLIWIMKNMKNLAPKFIRQCDFCFYQQYTVAYLMKLRRLASHVTQLWINLFIKKLFFLYSLKFDKFLFRRRFKHFALLYRTEAIDWCVKWRKVNFFSFFHLLSFQFLFYRLFLHFFSVFVLLMQLEMMFMLIWDASNES